MKQFFFVATFFAASAPPLVAQFAYRQFDPSQDVQNTVVKRQVSGCACAYTSLFPDLKNVRVSPTSVETSVGQSVEIRYDASGVCMGQTVRNVNGQSSPPYGTATWEVGAVQQLPDTWGIITFKPGYSQPKTDSIQINVNVQCYDTGAKCNAPNQYVSCSMSATVPVVITPLKAEQQQTKSIVLAETSLKRPTAPAQMNGQNAAGSSKKLLIVRDGNKEIKP